MRSLTVYPSSLAGTGKDNKFPPSGNLRGKLGKADGTCELVSNKDLWRCEVTTMPSIDYAATPPSELACVSKGNKGNDDVIDGGGDDTAPILFPWMESRTKNMCGIIPCTHDGVLRLRGGGGGGVGKVVRAETEDGEERWDRVDSFDKNEMDMPPRNDNRGRGDEGDPFALAGLSEDYNNGRDPN